jgi:NAD(P)-dependent dehydrogenase (short-subunit alcohol dehydrogenase family)
MKLKDNVVMITGAYGVLGTAMCLRFAREGAALVCVGRNPEKLSSLVEKVQKSGGNALGAQADVTDIIAVRKAVCEGRKKFGYIDRLVNLAGGPSGDGHGDVPFAQKDFDICRYVIELNLIGAMAWAHEVIPSIIDAGGGKIVNVSSIDGLRGTSDPGKCDYAAAKSGMFGLTKSLAKELAPYKINVNAISLGAFADGKLLDNKRPETYELYKTTEVIKRFGEPDEAAGLVTFLLSGEADYITGQNYIMDGGCYM